MSEANPNETGWHCPFCGDCDGEWVDCWQCGGEGEFDDHDDDPVNYAPGESFTRCEECKGRGGWTACVFAGGVR